jgi:alpha/beta superfamily hydrolase
MSSDSVQATIQGGAHSIAGPVGTLEVLVDMPSTADGSRVAVICHPHPLFGGNMNNKVAHILARTCNDLNAIAVRFNFRGVGQSAGTHDDGRGEADDVLAVIRWAEQQWPGAQVWLAGFSFGAAMALRAALQHRVSKLVTVAPALRWLQQLDGTVPECPWLVVQGDQDELVDAHAVQAWASGLQRPPEMTLLPGAEHFFHGRLNDLRDVVTRWLSR